MMWANTTQQPQRDKVIIILCLKNDLDLRPPTVSGDVMLCTSIMGLHSLSVASHCASTKSWRLYSLLSERLASISSWLTHILICNLHLIRLSMAAKPISTSHSTQWRCIMHVLFRMMTDPTLSPLCNVIGILRLTDSRYVQCVQKHFDVC